MATPNNTHSLTVQQITETRQKIRDVKKLKRKQRTEFFKNCNNRLITLKTLTKELGLHITKIDTLGNRPTFYGSSLYLFLAAVTFNAERRLNEHSEETRRLEEEFRWQQLVYAQELLQLRAKLGESLRVMLTD